MRVLQIITLAEMGGAQRHVLDLISTTREKVDITLVVGTDGWLVQQAQSLGICCHVVPSLGRSVNLWKDLTALRQLVALIRSAGADIVHVHSSKAGLLGRIAATIVGVPSIYTAHGWGFKPGVPLRRRFAVLIAEALAARLATRIICVSGYDFQLAARNRLFPTKRLVEIRNGVADDSPTWHARQDGRCRFVMVARFQEPKLQTLLLAAFSQLGPEGKELWFLGDGPDLEVVKRQAAGIAGVTFWGNQNNARELIAKCDVFVLLSAYEGLPLSIIEAMQAGLPVIASRVGGVPELVAHRESGLVVDNNVDDVVWALSSLLCSAELRVGMGQAGRKRYLRSFGLRTMADAVERQYAEVHK